MEDGNGFFEVSAVIACFERYMKVFGIGSLQVSHGEHNEQICGCRLEHLILED